MVLLSAESHRRHHVPLLLYPSPRLSFPKEKPCTSTAQQAAQLNSGAQLWLMKSIDTHLCICIDNRCVWNAMHVTYLFYTFGLKASAKSPSSGEIWVRVECGLYFYGLSIQHSSKQAQVSQRSLSSRCGCVLSALQSRILKMGFLPQTAHKTH